MDKYLTNALNAAREGYLRFGKEGALEAYQRFDGHPEIGTDRPENLQRVEEYLRKHLPEERLPISEASKILDKVISEAVKGLNE